MPIQDDIFTGDIELEPRNPPKPPEPASDSDLEQSVGGCYMGEPNPFVINE